ncbi:hypothetical protein CLOM_g17223 [Closterium sp. NIES-68]|nr:hypothetical protein CLOM_g17223 [Closterium sp. NIES-68]GJP67253.1 hypothetical protein CLOP_g24096 [Closterium sp. NIES-67]
MRLVLLAIILGLSAFHGGESGPALTAADALRKRAAVSDHVRVSNLARVSNREEFHERLMLEPLPDGRVLAHFAFESRLRAGGSEAGGSPAHTVLFPPAILHLVRSLHLRHLSLSLAHGSWDVQQWGTPSSSPSSSPFSLSHPPPLSHQEYDARPPGAELLAWMGGDESELDATWHNLTHSLAGLFCASLNFLESSSTVSSPSLHFQPSPHDPQSHSHPPSQPTSSSSSSSSSSSPPPSQHPSLHVRYGSMAREPVCTENLTPWLKLLPCRDAAGLAALLDRGAVFGGRYHSLRTSVWTDVCDEGSVGDEESVGGGESICGEGGVGGADTGHGKSVDESSASSSTCATQESPAAACPGVLWSLVLHQSLTVVLDASIEHALAAAAAAAASKPILPAAAAAAAGESLDLSAVLPLPPDWTVGALFGRQLTAVCPLATSTDVAIRVPSSLLHSAAQLTAAAGGGSNGSDTSEGLDYFLKSNAVFNLEGRGRVRVQERSGAAPLEGSGEEGSSEEDAKRKGGAVRGVEGMGGMRHVEAVLLHRDVRTQVHASDSSAGSTATSADSAVQLGDVAAVSKAGLHWKRRVAWQRRPALFVLSRFTTGTGDALGGLTFLIQRGDGHAKGCDTNECDTRGRDAASCAGKRSEPSDIGSQCSVCPADAVSVFQAVPWWLKLYLHTLTLAFDHRPISISDGSAVVAARLQPTRERGPPAVLELVLQVPRTVTRVTITVQYRKAFLTVFESPPDASRGVDLPAALLTVPSDPHGPSHMYAPPVVVPLPLPDLSMPYNVITLTCTLLAVVLGSLFNTLRYRPSTASPAGISSGADASGTPGSDKTINSKSLVDRLKENRKKIVLVMAVAAAGMAASNHFFE